MLRWQLLLRLLAAPLPAEEEAFALAEEDTDLAAAAFPEARN